MRHLPALSAILSVLLCAAAAVNADVAVYPTEVGSFKAAGWEYRYSILDRKTRSQGCWGHLTFAGREVTAPVNSVVSTPVGTFLFLGHLDYQGWGEHGWFNTHRDYNGEATPVFKADGSVITPYGLPIKRLSVLELLNLNKIAPNQSLDPTLSSGTPAAGQPARHP
jgi:opacity protein-like surface antigen